LNSFERFIPRIFLSPYPSVKKGLDQLRQAVTVGILISLILYLTAPFGLSNIQPEALRATICFTFGSITIIVVIITHTVSIYSFPSFFKTENWTVGKDIFMTLVHFFMVGNANFIFGWTKGWISFELNSFFIMQLSTLAVGALPVGVLTILQHNRLLRNSLKEAKNLNKLRVQHKTATPKSTIVLIGNNRDEEVHTSLDELLFVQSEGNYVEIYTTKTLGRARLLRNTLSSIEDLLQEYPQLIRCHRSFIVNLEKVEGVQGNAQGLRLELGIENIKVPVSRSYLQIVQSYLKDSEQSS